MRPGGKATGSTRLELVASEVRAARPGGEASSLPEVEGEAGMPVTVVSLPGRRAGLEFVEKLLTVMLSAAPGSGCWQAGAGRESDPSPHWPS
jgi:hypothetical protein